MSSMETEPVLENYLLEIKEEPIFNSDDGIPGDINQQPSSMSVVEEKSDNVLQFYLFEDGNLKRIRNVGDQFELNGSVTTKCLEFKCKLCGKHFQDERSLQKHVTNHETLKQYPCRFCDAVLMKPAVYEEHLKDFHKINEPFKCVDCDMVFTTDASLVRHNNALHLKDDKSKEHKERKKYNCEFCGKSFEITAFKTHLRTHTGEKPFKCEICDRTFNAESSFKRHLKIHLGVRPYKCEICGKSMIQKLQLDDHMLTHSEEKKFSCSICGKKFTTRKNIKRHTLRHTAQRCYSCKLCTISFVDLAELKVHSAEIHGNAVLEYENEKIINSFLCYICGKNMSTKYSAQVHMRSQHNGCKPYKCSFCDKTFTQKIVLTNHLRTHTGERPFVCGVCQSSFSQKCALVVHMKIHDTNKTKKKSRKRKNLIEKC